MEIPAPRRKIQRARPVAAPPALHVNMKWPETVAFDFVPPQLLQALPPLPPELQYPIIGRVLVPLWTGSDRLGPWHEGVS